MALRNLCIRPYLPRDMAGVARVFVDGSAFYKADFPGEHWDTFIQESLDGDLSKVEERYMAPGGNFWVATASVEPSEDEQVVGIVGLEKRSDQEAELRRMAVSTVCRRGGVGRKLVAELEQWAKAQGFARVLLMNGGPREDARDFYRAIGYKDIGTVVVSKDPFIEVFRLAKDL